MAEYKINEGSKKDILHKQRLKSLPLIIVAVAAGFVIAYHQNPDKKLFIMTLPIVLVIAGIAIFTGMKFGSKIFKETQVDIVIRMENGIFTMLKGGSVLISFTKEQISKIEQRRDKSIKILLKDKNRISLSDKIENHDALIAELSCLHNIDLIENEKTPNRRTLATMAMALTTVALMLIFYMTTDKITMVATGSVLIMVLLVSAMIIFTNKHVDKRIKYNTAFIFLVILMIISRILSAL